MQIATFDYRGELSRFQLGDCQLLTIIFCKNLNMVNYHPNKRLNAIDCVTFRKRFKV